MNKKAFITYIVLLVFVAFISYYIYNASHSKPSSVKQSATSSASSTTANATVNSLGVNQSNAPSASGLTNRTYNSTVANSTQCVPASGYLCLGTSLSRKTGQLTITFEQETGLTWGTAHIFFMNSTEIPDIKSYPSYSLAGTLLLNVTPYSAVSAYINILPANSSPGSTAVGEVWSSYTIGGNNATYYNKIANVTVTAK